MDPVSDHRPESSIQDVEMKSSFVRATSTVNRVERSMQIPRPNRSSRTANFTFRPRCHCPTYGVRAIAGRRARMEDAVSIVENLLEISRSNSNSGLRPPQQSKEANEMLTAIPPPPPPPPNGSMKTESIIKGTGVALDDAPMETEVVHFFGVYDGHNGPYAANHCRGRLHENLRATYFDLLSGGESDAESETVALDLLSPSPNASSSSSSSSPASSYSTVWTENGADLNGQKTMRQSTRNGWLTSEELFLETFRRTDSQFSEYRCAERVGTTALTALVGAQNITVGSCGDSRAVLYRSGQAIQMSNDHRLDKLDEKDRIESCGGQITYWNGPRVMGVLAMSRAIGDLCFRRYGVICDPEVTTKSRSIDDEYLLLATDGLWDVLTNEEAYRIIRHTIATNNREGVDLQGCVQSAANRLTRIAMDRGSRDNITVILLDLQSDNHQFSPEVETVSLNGDFC